MTTISIKLTEALLESIEQEAKRRGLTRSEMVRVALQELIQQQGGRTEDSCYALMKDGAGMVKEAPKDLSHAQRHMKEFGR